MKTSNDFCNQLPEQLKKLLGETSVDKRNPNRYIEVVGGIGMCRYELNDGYPVTGYTGLFHRTNAGFVGEVSEIGKFTRENVTKWLEECHGIGPELRPIEDFHAVCDDIDIPWATKRGKAIWTTVMVEGKPWRDDEETM